MYCLIFTRVNGSQRWRNRTILNLIFNSSLFRIILPSQDIILAFGDIAMTVNHTILLEKTLTRYSDHLFFFSRHFL